MVDIEGEGKNRVLGEGWAKSLLSRIGKANQHCIYPKATFFLWEALSPSQSQNEREDCIKTSTISLKARLIYVYMYVCVYMN